MLFKFFLRVHVVNLAGDNSVTTHLLIDPFWFFKRIERRVNALLLWFLHDWNGGSRAILSWMRWTRGDRALPFGRRGDVRVGIAAVALLEVDAAAGTGAAAAAAGGAVAVVVKEADCIEGLRGAARLVVSVLFDSNIASGWIGSLA